MRYLAFFLAGLLFGGIFTTAASIDKPRRPVTAEGATLSIVVAIILIVCLLGLAL